MLTRGNAVLVSQNEQGQYIFKVCLFNLDLGISKVNYSMLICVFSFMILDQNGAERCARAGMSGERTSTGVCDPWSSQERVYR